MPDRWIAFCRRLAPATLRDTAFDPAVADLCADEAARAGADQGASRRAGRARLRLRILATAVECRRLAARSTPAILREDHARSAGSIAWRPVFREAVRGLIRQPGFALASVLVLALGIGANLTVFSFVNSLLIAPIAAPDPGRLVRVHGVAGERRRDTVSYPNYLDARAFGRSLDLAAHVQTAARIGTQAVSESRTVELVTGNYFRVLGLLPSAGRLIEERDDASEGAHPVVTVSHDFWQSRLGGDPAAIGRTLLISGAAFQIVGIAPPAFRGTFNGHAVDLWAPLSMQQQVRPRGQSRMNRNWGWLRMIGRIREGASDVQARAELAEAAADINRRFPASPPPLGFEVVPASAMSDGDRGTVQPFLAIVFGFTVLLFVVTCANLAGVMQARLISRTRDLAIRRSLGASRGRLAVSWLTEAFVLSAAGALAGVFASRLVTALVAQIEVPGAVLGDLKVVTTLDWRVWVFAFGIAVVASILFGVSPAFRAGRASPLEVLKDESGTVATGRRGLRLRRTLVFVQVAVSVALLAAAGLLAAGLARERGLDPGYSTRSLGLLGFSLQGQPIASTGRADATRRLLELVRADPGVVSADLVMNPPLSLGSDRMRFRVPGHATPDGTGNLSIEFNVVGAEYFATLGTPFAAGAAWDPRTIARDAPPVIVNETMARRYWKDGQAVGEPVEVVGRGVARVSGIVRDSAYRAVGETPFPVIYLPAEIDPPGSFAVLVRTTIGLYGVASMSVAQRTREIGLRIALGAGPGAVVRGIAGEVALVVVLGAIVGSVGAVYLGRGLRTWLTGLPGFDPVVAVLTGLLLLLVAVIATWVPARRASRVDPVAVLRG